MSTNQNKNGKAAANEYEDIDEAEEEALLKSDDEGEGSRARVNPGVLKPPEALQDDDDSLINEAPQLAPEPPAMGGNGGVAAEGDGDFEDLVSDIEDDDDDINNPVLLEYKEALDDLQKNQYVYDKFMSLCDLSHRTNDLQNIRTAYELFASAYPLTPELWLKYIRIELTVSQSPVEVQHVDRLFKKALSDYFSIDVALEYAKFAARTFEPQRIWDEVLGTYALHCMRGQELFKLYREYIDNHNDLSAPEKQDEYVKSFLRELKYPLHNMEKSYIEFKVFYEKNKDSIEPAIDWANLDLVYFKAKGHLQLIRPFEEELIAINVKKYRERAEVYLRYIQVSHNVIDVNIFQTIYERMVADCCLISDCWTKYVDYVDLRDETGRPAELQALPLFKQDALDINQRALRNCTWSGDFYISRIRLLEKTDQPREEVQEVLETSINAGFESAEPAVAIWLEYLTYLRRHVDWDNEGQCDILRKNFNLAWTILGKNWGVLADCDCEILKFWGRLEYGPLQIPKRGKELWSTVMESSDNETRSGLWVEFAQLEMRYDLESTRKIYRKALSTGRLDRPDVIVSAWERFERCNGTVKTLIACNNECLEFMRKYQKKAQKLAAEANNNAKSSVKGTKRSANEGDETVSGKRSKTPVNGAGRAERQRGSATAEDRQARELVFKEHETQAIDLSKDHLRIFLSNLDYNLNEDDVREGLKALKIVSVNLIRSANGRSRGFGYMELESVEEVEKALRMDRYKLNSRPVFISSVLRDKEQRQKFRYSDAIEPQKLFVKGLPHDVTKVELETLFGKCGTLKEVRLVYHKSGKFKNLAYVEFEDATAAARAVMELDEQEMHGHTLSVAISAPPPKHSGQSGNAAKLLGATTRYQKAPEKKQRIMLIPNVIRKRMITEANDDMPSTSARCFRGVQPPPAATSGKTNADFRDMMLHK